MGDLENPRFPIQAEPSPPARQVWRCPPFIDTVQETLASIAMVAFDRPSRFLAALAAWRAARATGFSAAKRAC